MTLFNLFGLFGYTTNTTTSYSSKDGIVDGTDGADNMGAGYTDSEGDQINNNANLIDARGGDDTVHALDGNDVVLGGSGDDSIDGGHGNDLLLGDSALTEVKCSSSGTYTLAVWDLSKTTVRDEHGNIVSPSNHAIYPWEDSTSGESTHDIQGLTFSFDAGTEPVAVGVNDGDAHFDDGDLSQDFAQTTTLNGETGHAGERFTPEYQYSIQSSTGEVINIYVSEIGGNNAAALVSDKPLQAGETYTFIEKVDTHPSIAYSDIADGYLVGEDAEGAGDDTLVGGSGHDTLVGEGGDDLLKGGSGDDTLIGDGNGSDYVDGIASGSDGVKQLAVFDITNTVVRDAHGNIVSNGSHQSPWENSSTGEPTHDIQNFTFSVTSGPQQVGVSDNDSLFNDGDKNQVLDQTTTLDGSTEHAGDRITPEYQYSIQSSGGEIINIYVVEFDGNDAVGFVADAPIVEDETYTFIGRVSTYPDVDYDSLYSDYFGGGADDDSNAGNDTLHAGDGNDLLQGNGGDDLLLGEAGNDTLEGGTGNDVLDGGTGNDQLDGGAGNDALNGGDGDDSAVGGNGDDTLVGEAGNDTLIGDGGDGLETGERESFEWIDQYHPGTHASGFTQDTGEVSVTYNKTIQGHVESTVTNTDVQYDGVDVDSEYDGENSGLKSVLDNTGEKAVYSFDFSQDVANLKFSIADIDEDSQVVIKAFDADGNPLEVNITSGAGLSTVGNTVTSQQGYVDSDDLSAQAVVSIDGPVASLLITHQLSGGDDRSGVYISDLFYDPILGETVAAPGDDELFGGDGSDVLEGNEGRDLLDGGADADTIDGGAGADTIVGGTDGDQVDGGSGGDIIFDAADLDDTQSQDFDTLDLTGIGNFRLENLRPDSNGNGQDGTVVLLDAKGDPTGESFTFTEIEQILGEEFVPSNGLVEGANGDDTISGGFVDDDGDAVDGNDALLTGENGNDDIIVAGEGNDSVDGLDGNDEIYGGAGDDTVNGGVGDDLIVGDDDFPGRDGVTAPDLNGGDPGDDSLSGGDGNDTILGNEGNDTLDGGADDDTLEGGAGDDILLGGAGNDDITGGDGSDGVIGGDGDDVIDTSGNNPLDDAIDPTPNDDLDTVLGGAGNDTIMTGDDADSIDGGAGDDVIDAGIDDDTVTGGGGNDDITAGDGNDLVDAGAGNDVVDGGLGDDTIQGGNGDDSITGGDGNDEVRGGGGNDTVDGGAGDDSVFGGSEDDTLLGGEGNDMISAGLGDDSIDGGDGNDEVSGGMGNDTINGGAGSDSLHGNLGDDLIDGGDDNDTISGQDGDDTLLGGLGDDSITGGDGSDEIDGGDGADFIDASGNDPEIDADVPLVQPGDEPIGDEDPNPNNDRDLIVGGAGNDTILTGDDADTIFGGAGDDSIDSGIDDDSVEGGDGDDFITDAQGSDTIFGGEGNDTILAGTDTFTDTGEEPFLPNGLPNPFFGVGDPNPDDGRDLIDGGAGNDSIVTGDDDDTIYGGDGNDTIDAGIDDDLVYGQDGDDVILGGQGDDTIFGGDGADTIDGGAGDDSIRMGNGDDSVDGGDGNDTILGGASGGSDTVNGGEGDDLIVGGAGGDELNGDGGNDFIRGNLADDSIDGGEGDDTLVGGLGDDSILGGDGNDSINAAEGNDTVDGGAGDDTINGGDPEGADLLQGGDDADTFILVGGGDTVLGGSGGNDFDTLDLRGSTPEGGGFQIINRTPDNDPGDTIDGDSPNDGEDGTVVFFDSAGNETGRLEFENIERIIPCFTPGTLIATPKGEIRVEDLREGDRVITRDNGIQEISWVGNKRLSREELVRQPELKPVLIRQGSLGYGLPERDMLVSPNHRMLSASDETALYFEEREVLVSAKHLTHAKGVDQVEALGVNYIHFMFERHEVVLSDGTWSESFQPGDYTLKGIGDDQRAEILTLFPELEQHDGIDGYQSARRSLKKHEARLLLK